MNAKLRGLTANLLFFCGMTCWALPADGHLLVHSPDRDVRQGLIHLPEWLEGLLIVLGAPEQPPPPLPDDVENIHGVIDFDVEPSVELTARYLQLKQQQASPVRLSKFKPFKSLEFDAAGLWGVSGTNRALLYKWSEIDYVRDMIKGANSGH